MRRETAQASPFLRARTALWKVLPELRGRSSERTDRLLDDARGGRSAVLVVHGEPGIGERHCCAYRPPRIGTRVRSHGLLEALVETIVDRVHHERPTLSCRLPGTTLVPVCPFWCNPLGRGLCAIRAEDARS